jgi:hypothetical protein
MRSKTFFVFLALLSMTATALPLAASAGAGADMEEAKTDGQIRRGQQEIAALHTAAEQERAAGQAAHQRIVDYKAHLKAALDDDLPRLDRLYQDAIRQKGAAEASLAEAVDLRNALTSLCDDYGRLKGSIDGSKALAAILNQFQASRDLWMRALAKVDSSRQINQNQQDEQNQRDEIAILVKNLRASPTATARLPGGIGTQAEATIFNFTASLSPAFMSQLQAQASDLVADLGTQKARTERLADLASRLKKQYETLRASIL